MNLAAGKMSFREHLLELRRRLIICVAVFFVLCVCAYPVAPTIFHFLALPLTRALHALPGATAGMATLHFAGLLEGVFTYLKVACFFAAFLSSPVVLYQAWKFIVPALHPHEKRYVRIFVLGGFVLFTAGMAFFYTIVLPTALGIFLGQADAEIKPVLMMGQYLSLVTMFMLIFGFCFEIPLVMLLLSLMGLIDYPLLARTRRYAIVVITVVAAVFTPPDVVSQILMGVPLLVLYELGIWLVRLQNLLFKPRETR